MSLKNSNGTIGNFLNVTLFAFCHYITVALLLFCCLVRAL